MSETSKQRQHTVKYLIGNGIDIASGGDPVVPWAISMDLPPAEYSHYNNTPEDHKERFQWRGHAHDLPFKTGTLDFVYSSHLIEDYEDWMPILREWVRVLKSSGHLVIMLPDKELWQAALRRGQPPNCAHRHESFPGELTQFASKFPLNVIEDRLTNSFGGDYNILFVGQKR